MTSCTLQTKCEYKNNGNVIFIVKDFLSILAQDAAGAQTRGGHDTYVTKNLGGFNFTS